MKKKVLIITLFVTFFAVFAALGITTYTMYQYKDNVIDTMYVDSPEGIRIRSTPYVYSKSKCFLPNRFPVKVVAVSYSDTIDNVTAYWYEIVLPRFEWHGKEPSYGWVFGGYLKEQQPDFIHPKTSKQLENYLIYSHWWVDNKKYELIFGEDKTYWRGKPYSGIGETGTWKALSHNKIELFCEYIMEENEIMTKEEFPVYIIDENAFKINSDIYFSGFLEYDISFSPENEESAMLSSMYLYSFDRFGKTILQQDHIDEGLIPLAIAAGVSVTGTEFDNMYHDYWTPIVEKRQLRCSMTYLFYCILDFLSDRLTTAST